MNFKFGYHEEVVINDETGFVPLGIKGVVLDFIIQDWWEKLLNKEKSYWVALPFHREDGSCTEYCFSFKESELDKES